MHLTHTCCCLFVCRQVARKRIRNKPGNQAVVKPTASKPVPVNVTHSPANDINERTNKKSSTCVSPIQVAPIGITAHHSQNIVSVSSSLSDNVNVSPYREAQSKNMLQKNCANTLSSVNGSHVAVSTVTIEEDKFNESSENTAATRKGGQTLVYTVECNKEGNIDEETIAYDERNHEKCNVRASIDLMKEKTTNVTASVTAAGGMSGDVDEAQKIDTTHVNKKNSRPVKLVELDVHTLRDAEERGKKCYQTTVSSSASDEELKHLTRNTCSSVRKFHSPESVSCINENINGNKFVTSSSSHALATRRESKFPDRSVTESNEDKKWHSNRHEEEYHVNNAKSCVTSFFPGGDGVDDELSELHGQEKKQLLTKQEEHRNDGSSSKFVTRMSDEKRSGEASSSTNIMSGDEDGEENSSSANETKLSFTWNKNNSKSDVKVIKVQVEHAYLRSSISGTSDESVRDDEHHLPIDGNIESMKQIDVPDNMKGQQEEAERKKRKEIQKSAVNNVTMSPVNDEESTRASKCISTHTHNVEANITGELVNEDDKTQLHEVSSIIKVEEKYNQMSNEATDVTSSSVGHSSDTRVARVNGETGGHTFPASRNDFSSLGVRGNAVNKTGESTTTTTSTTTAAAAGAGGGSAVAISTSLSSALATRSIVTGCKSVKEARKEKERKTAKTLAIITGVFIVCW